MQGYYNAPVDVSLTASDTGGSGLKEIRYTTDGSTPTATTGTVYGGPFSVASTTTVKYRAFDNAGNAEAVNSQLIQVDTTPPTVSVSSPSDGSTVTGTATLSASATDEAGVDHVDFLVDGTVVGSDSTAPFSVGWNSTSVADGQHSITARAVDVSTNAATSGAVAVTVDNDTPPPPDTTAPSSSIACDSAACASGYYNAGVSVTLSATDTGGSGLKEIRYTTDGSTPTATSGTVYSGAFAVGSTTTVKYRAFDNAGNAEAVNSQPIQIDTTAPASTVKCDAAACASGYYGAAVSVTLSAADETGGSGLKEIRYTTDGSTPTATTGTVYGSAFSVGSTTTVKYRAFDNAGNAEAVNSQPIQIDTTAPTIAITAPTNGSTVTANVKITTNAADAASGLAKVTFYVDNTVLATVTAAPWTTNWNTKKNTKGQHVLTAVAEDKAGNTTTSAAVTVTVK
jgi:hypothetical protein